MASKRPLAIETIRVVLPVVILVAGAGAFLAIGGRREPRAGADSRPQEPLVQTVAVQPHEGGLTIETDGVVVPFREITLSAEVAGRVVKKAPEFRAGNYVTRKTLLVQIDPATYKLETERLTSERNQAQASLDELDVEEHSTSSLIELAEQQLALEQKEFARTERLYGKNIVTEAEMDTGRRTVLSARNDATSLRNQLAMLRSRRNRLEWAKKLAEARLKQAELDVAHTEIRAPVDGVVVSDLVEQDGYVQPGAAVATLEDTSAAEVHCSLRMDELHWIWQQAPAGSAAGQPRGPQQDYEIPHVPVTVVYRLGAKQYAWDGVLARYGGTGLDQKTRTVPCRVLVQAPRKVRLLGGEGPCPAGPRALLRGMFVSVQIHANPGMTLLKVPEQAVRPGNTVWRVRNGQIDVLRVPVAQLLDDGLLVVADETSLGGSDRVVTSPLASVRNGMTVREGAVP